jgi:uncharacterized membrane protein
VFARNMLHSRGLEPVNKFYNFYIKGPIFQKQLKIVNSFVFEIFAISDIVSWNRIGQNMHKSAIAIFNYTIAINKFFFNKSALKYKKLEEQFPEY